MHNFAILSALWTYTSSEFSTLHNIVTVSQFDVINNIDQSFNIVCHKVENAEDCKNFISKYKFKILNFNIRSINFNFDSFVTLLERLNLDFDVIVTLNTERWIKVGSVIGQIDGFSSFSSTKYINKCGGVVIYVRGCWNPIVSEPDLQDAMCLQVHIPNLLSILGIYRSPSFKDTTNYINSLESVVKSMPKSPCNIISGDININILNTDVGSEYLSMMSELGFRTAVDKPTRKDLSCLDHFFTTLKEACESVVCSSAVTDHDLLILGIEPNKPIPLAPLDGLECVRILKL